MLSNVELTKILRDNGYKVTPQRLAVYEVLASKRWHPSAEMLYNQLQPRYPAMSFATVYKTVEILEKLKLIQVLNSGEDCFRYDAYIEEHYHLQCQKCGELYDVELPGSARELTAMVEEESGFEVHSRQFYFFGVCQNCCGTH